MRVLTAMAIAAAALLPSAAAAQTTPTVQPDPAGPGDRISISDAENCTALAGTATSPALIAPISLSAQAHALTGTGTLRPDLISGSYTLTLHCGTTVTATVHVANTSRAQNPLAQRGTAATTDDHLGIGDAALGSAFVLGGLGFGAVALRRRRRAAARD